MEDCEMNKEDIIKYFLVMRDTADEIESLSEELKSVSSDERFNSYFSFTVSNIKQNIVFLSQNRLDVESNIRVQNVPEIKDIVIHIKRAKFVLFPVLLDVMMKDEEWGKYSNLCYKIQEMPLLLGFAPYNSTNSNNEAKFPFNQNMIDKVYDECDGKLWQSINDEDFKKMLVSGNINIQIKNRNKKRVNTLFKRISFTITDETAKSEWEANVERSLGIERLSKIEYKLDETNSEPNKKFNRFLDSIYSK